MVAKGWGVITSGYRVAFWVVEMFWNKSGDATQFCEYTKTADLYTYCKSEVYVISIIFQDKKLIEKSPSKLLKTTSSGMPRV